MKFIVSTGKLLKNLQLVGGVVGTNNVLPILEDFLFEIKGNELTVSATDLETSMSASLEVEAKEEIRVAIPAKILLDTIKTFAEQPITITVDSKSYAVEITSNNGKYKLAGENPDDFPKIPEAHNLSNIAIPANVLSSAINNTLFATSGDELKPAMMGVLLQINNDGCIFVATDAHKLVRFKHLTTKSSQAASLVLPKKPLTILKNALLTEDGGVEIAYNNTNAFFNFGNIQLVCRLIDAKFPDYNAVIPLENPNKLTISKKDLLNSVKRVALFSNKSTNQIVLKLSGSEMQISAQDIDFSNEAVERLACQYEGKDMEIGFNGRFLLEVLSIIDSDEIRFELSTPTRAGVFFPTKAKENEDLLMLVMPVMLNT